MLLQLRDKRPGSETRTAVALGLALGATVLLRQVFLVLIPFLLLLFGIVDLGRGIYAYNGVAEAPRGLARVTEERDILKKATAYFARESQ